MLYNCYCDEDHVTFCCGRQSGRRHVNISHYLSLGANASVCQLVALKMQGQRFVQATGQLTVRFGQNGQAHVQMLGQLAKMRGQQKVRNVNLNVTQMLCALSRTEVSGQIKYE